MSALLNAFRTFDLYDFVFAHGAIDKQNRR